MTVHKSQGSASPVVICAMDYSHYMMLKRSLLYTAITRASELLFLVADKRAVAIAIKNDTQVDKNTYLCDFLNSDKLD
jgi:ATP-dependent exoDNAse (exonuclease V) alpha subunit